MHSRALHAQSCNMGTGQGPTWRAVLLQPSWSTLAPTGHTAPWPNCLKLTCHRESDLSLQATIRAPSDKTFQIYPWCAMGPERHVQHVFVLQGIACSSMQYGAWAGAGMAGGALAAKLEHSGLLLVTPHLGLTALGEPVFYAEDAWQRLCKYQQPHILLC